MAGRSCLEHGASAGIKEITALAQAKLGYVGEALSICARFRGQVFASVVEPNSSRPNPNYLRKDYAFLFERFFYFLEEHSAAASGIIVFDELEKSESHLLVGQMERYFKFTARGRQRAGQIIPEPFFVHSELTTGIQLADLVAYIVSWGVRFGGLTEPARAELGPFARQVRGLGCDFRRRLQGRPDFRISSFVRIRDLRGREDQKEG